MLEFDWVITNGYVDRDTMAYFIEKGWVFVCTVPAKTAHPHAMDTDKLAIFSKYTAPEQSEVGECNQANNM